MAPWLSDAQLGDLACQLAVEAAGQARLKVAIVASRQEQLARLARLAITALPGLIPGVLSTRPGIFAADGADGTVTLLLADQPDQPEPPEPSDQPAPEQQLNRALAVLRRLDELGVQPAAVVGQGIGELAGLVWAGCLGADDARRLNTLRHRALTASSTEAPGSVGRAIDEFAATAFSGPGGRLISGCTGAELTSAAEIPHVLSAGLLDARSAATGGALPVPADQRLAAAVRTAAAGTSLIVQAGRDSRDRDLTTCGDGDGQRREIAVVTIDGDPDDRSIARAAAALFASGALTGLSCSMPAIRPGRSTSGASRSSSPAPARRARKRSHSPPSHRSRRQPPACLAQPRQSPRPPQPQPQPQPQPEPDKEPATVGRRIAGVGPWACCYAERLIAPARPVAAPDDGPWRIFTGGCDATLAMIGDVFRHEHAASRTLAFLGHSRDEDTVQAALVAARDAISTGTLVAVSPDPGLTGLWATLHAEHPTLGVTAVRAPLTRAGIQAASRLGAEPGSYTELVVRSSGELAEPAMAPLAPRGASGFPAGPGDVVLITRGSGAAGLALAQVLACAGATIAMIGRDHASHDDAVLETLEQLRLGGATVGYEVVDLGSSAALNAAVRRIELRLGPVTAVAHAATTPPSHPVADLTDAELRAHVLSQTRALDQVVTAVRARDGIRRTPADQLRLILTFGSVIGRYGLAREGLVALSCAVLADFAEQLASAGPGCQALHVDWPTWAGAGLGERPDLVASLRQAGYASMPVATGSRLLLKLLGAGDLPSRAAIHGRVGHQAPVPVAAMASRADGGSPVPRWRFAERICLHYPGVELITEATLTPQADPYLADYIVDGVYLLPPAMALEAMAEAASTLAGRPMRAAEEISMSAPVVLAAGQPAVIRICAQRDDDGVTVVIRDASTGYAVDHFRATFTSVPQPTIAPRQASKDRRPDASTNVTEPRRNAARPVTGTIPARSRQPRSTGRCASRPGGSCA